MSTILEQWYENCGRSCGDAPEQARADARALWAVRVLDAWADAKSCDPFKTARLGGEWHCTSAYGPKTLGIGQRFIGSTPDAARLAAADAVYPALPTDVQATLGVRP